jgi:NAD(P)-dependent dehydrogenase (short-subunit alcohol dehydrogenase family)
VNSVQPGLHDTARARHVFDEQFTSAAAALAVGGAGHPEELGKAVAFLCSRHAAFITGVGLPIDGGASSSMP